MRIKNPEYSVYLKKDKYIKDFSSFVSKQVKNQILSEYLVRIDKVDDPLQRRILSSALLVKVDKGVNMRKVYLTDLINLLERNDFFEDNYTGSGFVAPDYGDFDLSIMPLFVNGKPFKNLSVSFDTYKTITGEDLKEEDKRFFTQGVLAYDVDDELEEELTSEEKLDFIDEIAQLYLSRVKEFCYETEQYFFKLTFEDGDVVSINSFKKSDLELFGIRFYKCDFSDNAN